MSAQLLSPAEIENQLADDLIPIWFDLKSVEDDFESLLAYLKSNKDSESAGAKIYRASLAVARCQRQPLEIRNDPGDVSAKQQLTTDTLNRTRIEQAEAAIEKLNQLPERLRGWKVLLTSQLNLNQQLFGPVRTALNNQRAYFARAEPNQQAVSKFLKGQALGNSETDSAKVDAILSLLSIPARWENQFPTLSSAALYEAIQVAEKRETVEEMRIIRDELLAKYPSTYHGRLAKQPKAIDPFGGG